MILANLNRLPIAVLHVMFMMAVEDYTTDRNTNTLTDVLVLYAAIKQHRDNPDRAGNSNEIQTSA